MSKTLFALAAALCLPIVAQAGTVTKFVQVQNGVFDDAGLTGYSTWAMRVEADTDWTNADLSIELATGSLNNVAPAFLGSPNGVNGFGDTAGMAPTVVNGDITGGFVGVAGFAGDHSESANSFQSSWFTTETGDIGTFDIAMITISDDANGELLYRTIAGNDVEEGGFTIGSKPVWFVRNGQIVVPEPTSLALAALGLIGVCGAARRRS